MQIVVPFDGSPLSTAALERATTLKDAFEADLLVVSVIPNGNDRYARARGWLDSGESFDAERVVSRLSRLVSDIAPTATFEYEVVGQFAQAGAIASTIRSRARVADADMVVIGSDNAGQIVSSVSSVGSSVATDDSYDVLIVRQLGPAED